MRYVFYAAYYVLARWLPESRSIGGGVSKSCRGFLCRRLFAHCGDDVNIERGARFDSGRKIHLGARSGLGVNSRLIGPVRIGDDVMMGPEVVILTRNHAFADPCRPM